MVKTRNKNSKSTKKIFERATRLRDDVKRALTSAITSNDIITVPQKELSDKTQRLESHLLAAADHSLTRTENKIHPFMHHGTGENLNPEPQRDANNGIYDTDPKNHVPNFSDERFEHPIKSSNLHDENAVRSFSLSTI